jgi:hypothetical protein
LTAPGPAHQNPRAALLPVIDIEGPRVRLGVAWAAITAVALVAGPVATAIVFAGVALAAAGQACRTWRTHPMAERPYRPIAVGGAVVCALAAPAGPIAIAAAAACAAVAALAASQLRWGRRDWSAKTTIAIAVLIGIGAAAVPLLRDRLGLVPTAAFVAWVHAVDASTFIVGSGAGRRWEGIVAGAATAGAVGLAVAAVLVPPFRGASPWILAALPAVLVPLGTIAGTLLLGRDEAPVPGLRRLDGFLVAGPVWAVVATVVLDL